MARGLSVMRRLLAVGCRTVTRASPTPPPTTCIATYAGAEAGAMPAKVSERVRAAVTAGLAKLVELVNQ